MVVPQSNIYLDFWKWWKWVLLEMFSRCWIGVQHGSLNVPIEHHPTIKYMVYNGYYKVMSNSPKMGHLPTPVQHGTTKNGWSCWKKWPTCSPEQHAPVPARALTDVPDVVGPSASSIAGTTFQGFQVDSCAANGWKSEKIHQHPKAGT